MSSIMVKKSGLLICLIVGNMVGAGILALPINTGLSGLIPSLAGMLVLGGAMFFSAVVLSGEAVAEKMETFNFPSLYGKYIGPAGKWIAILANMLILYGLLVAYITGAAKIIGDFLQLPDSRSWLVMLGFCAAVTLPAIWRSGWLLACLAGLVLFKVAAFLLMTGIAEPHIDAGHYRYADWAYLPASAAILVTSFHFHNIIPNICRELNWSFSAVWKTILLGMVVGFIMNAVWIQVSLGVLPLGGDENGLVWAFQRNLPATVPMAHVLASRLFTLCGIGFAMVALATAYMSNGLGLRGFMRDLLVNHCRVNLRGLDLALTFLPPLAVALIYPNIFLKAIDLVGGVGIVVLFGILPAIIWLKQARAARARALAWLMLALFAACLAIEVLQEFGLLRLRPEMEYFNPPVAPQDAART